MESSGSSAYCFSFSLLWECDVFQIKQNISSVQGYRLCGCALLELTFPLMIAMVINVDDLLAEAMNFLQMAEN